MDFSATIVMSEFVDSRIFASEFFQGDDFQITSTPGIEAFFLDYSSVHGEKSIFLTPSVFDRAGEDPELISISAAPSGGGIEYVTSGSLSDFSFDSIAPAGFFGPWLLRFTSDFLSDQQFFLEGRFVQIAGNPVAVPALGAVALLALGLVAVERARTRRKPSCAQQAPA